MGRRLCIPFIHPHVITERGMYGDAGTCLRCGADGYGLRGLRNTPLGEATPEQRARLEELED